MSVEETWRKNEGIDEDLSLLIRGGVSKLNSKDPLIKMRQLLLWGSILGLLVAAVYVVIIAMFPLWQVTLCMGVVFIYTLWASFKSMVLFREMYSSSLEHSLLEELESHYSKLKKWCSIQQEVAVFVYPASATGGFMLGGSAGSGKSIDELMHKPAMIIALLVTLAILVPICFYVTKWLTRKFVGKYIDQLGHNIDALKSNK